jgi:hypothetical protein
MGQGRIWPEYWIDCSACDDHEPLAESEPTRAVQEALRRGWTKIGDKWQCPFCIAKAKAQTLE